MNAGRAPTRIGGDGILPFLDVPHWFAGDVKRVLRLHRVEFEILDGYARLTGSDDPDDHTDRLIFPSAKPEQVQWLVDSIRPRGRG